MGSNRYLTIFSLDPQLRKDGASLFMGRWPAIGFNAAALNLGIQQNRYPVDDNIPGRCLEASPETLMHMDTISCQSKPQTTEQARRKRIAHLSCYLCASAQSPADRGSEEPCQQASKSARHLGISSGPCRTLTHMASQSKQRRHRNPCSTAVSPASGVSADGCLYLLLLVVWPCHK
ncbi:hypothetical protein CI102_3662 [Trichoderma harzianum]|uniref:Uncharacterized protein n=1 Tax=Trichoderma harzianum CBS 226.95 TaxID=983964 RepID=A0A2T4AIR5_TRIHA|nr:hypothetical protein M431DRAFT_389461 [Trichoderma harzianum CBS 226.95]PKK52131.1 hypothetical protein CI102_3662 [Trichoderma harzianum]PTB56937.1 hypothetical protein M431DRAFT_389461 [Trichoderma harzianum CBS 226.95]